MTGTGRVVISIAGPSGSGKSQLALAVVRLLGDDVAARVPMDWFIVPRDCPMDEWLRQPLAWEHAAVQQVLDAVDGSTRLTPPFDFTTFTRSATTGARKAIPIRSMMVLDAMAPWPDADLSVCVDVPDAVRRQRLIDRDTRWGTRVTDRWEQMEITRRHIASQRHMHDLIVDGERSIDENATRIVAALRSRGCLR